MTEAEPDRYEAVRQALRRDSPAWVVQHIDVTCDGCECEPIVGSRFKCSTCEDIDLCGRCFRALVAARLKAAEEGAPLRPTRPSGAGGGNRPRRWVAKLHSRDTQERWAALQHAVPCLHPSHKFARVLDGPERAVVFLGSTAAAAVNGSSGSGAGGEEEEQQRRQQNVKEVGEQMQQQLGSCLADLSLAEGASKGSSSARAGEQQQQQQRQEEGGPLAAQLEDFLATFPPSGASCRDLAWIVVQRPAGSGDGSGQQGGPELEERVEDALEDWEVLTAPGRPPPTAADVDALARRHGLLWGKWMAFPQQGAEAEAAWAAVARAVVLGGLAPQAKISSVDPAKPDHVICVYTEDYQDRGDVGRVRDALRDALPPLRNRGLKYKPDVATYLGLYAGNEYNLRPTVYSATL